MVGQTPRPTDKNDGVSGNHNSFFNGNARKLGEYSFHQARKTLRFSDEKMHVLSQPFKFALIGKFSHGYLSMQVIESEIARFEDFSKLWIRQILLVDNFPMRLFKWTPTFSPKEKSPYAPVWIRLPNLPVQFFYENALFSIASMIGSTLQVDDATANFSRPSLARICIDINLEQPLDNEVALGFNSLLWVQKIEYERIPKYCTHCKHIGHDVAHCNSIESPAPEAQLQKEGMGHKDVTKNPTSKPTYAEVEIKKTRSPKDPEDLHSFLNSKRGYDSAHQVGGMGSVGAHGHAGAHAGAQAAAAASAHDGRACAAAVGMLEGAASRAQAAVCPAQDLEHTAAASAQDVPKATDLAYQEAAHACPARMCAADVLVDDARASGVCAVPHVLVHARALETQKSAQVAAVQVVDHTPQHAAHVSTNAHAENVASDPRVSRPGPSPTVVHPIRAPRAACATPPARTARPSCPPYPLP
ncbi:hypothetical protein CDL12_06879 [Handroanthus impetiginosus]|uniref:Uncharacterized protein n=1 Tax=Handroanthus impetiginosus TaxID=429701 RepID=A0A2G9HSA2_9LAMI|nr:hypothetical protein CDL12_06879 [Handroanthus impetiginosus]